MMTISVRFAAALVVAVAVAGPARAQFLDPFDGPSIQLDPEGLEGWSFFTGDGDAVIAGEPRLLFDVED